MPEEALARAVIAAPLAELVVRDRRDDVDGIRIRVTAVVPLLLDGTPTVALTYADRDLAGAAAAAGTVDLVLSDPRGTGDGWRPLVATLRVDVEPDPEGARMEESGLLDQEVRKHLVSRRLAGSMMARRQRWWYVARLLVRATEVRDVRPIPPRDPRDALLVTGDAIVPVGVTGWHRDDLALSPLEGGMPGSMHLPAPGPAVLYTHDRSLPDGERRTECLLRGTYRDGRFLVGERHGSPELPRWRLAMSWRAHRRLERACRAGLRAADR